MSLPLDQPDNYPWFPGSERAPLVDLGELAARLGSPVTYDRRGEVLWYSTMEYGLAGWKVYTWASGSGAEVVVDEAFRSGYALKLTTAKAGSAAVRLDRYFALARVEKVGFEFSLAFPETFNELQVQFTHYDGDNLHRGQLRIDCDDEIIQYLAAGSVWTDALEIPSPVYPTPTYHHFKVVLDFENDLYDRIMWGGLGYTFSDAPLYTTSSNAGPFTFIYLHFIGDSADTYYCLFGSFIMTGNEP